MYSKPMHSRVAAATLAACAAFAAVAALVPTAAQAQTAGAREQLFSAVNSALTPLLGTSSSEVVGRLMKVKIDGSISRNFNLAKVSQAAFGRGGGVAAADCRVTTTAANEPDEGLCLLEAGKREDPNGAYTSLAFSKNIGQGNIKFVKRAASNGSGDPVSVKLSDADAYKKALEFADILGLPRSEIPIAPAGAKVTLPVRSLVVGAGEKRGADTKFEIQKVVSLPRALVVPGGLIKDPATGVVLSHVLLPGNATFAITDAGVQFARIDGWSDAQFDPKLDPSKAKSVSQLASEITDDLYNEGVRKVGSLSILISLRRAYPNPDDPNPPLCPVCGVLRPALTVMISQVAAGKVDSSEKSFVAPGLVREYDLVDQVESERAAR
ncbi:hypothetical protein BH11PSE8_BH11PSE8_40350 [soil metagenome]